MVFAFIVAISGIIGIVTAIFKLSKGKSPCYQELMEDFRDELAYQATASPALTPSTSMTYSVTSTPTSKFGYQDGKVSLLEIYTDDDHE